MGGVPPNLEQQLVGLHFANCRSAWAFFLWLEELAKASTVKMPKLYLMSALMVLQPALCTWGCIFLAAARSWLISNQAWAASKRKLVKALGLDRDAHCGLNQQSKHTSRHASGKISKIKNERGTRVQNAHRVVCHLQRLPQHLGVIEDVGQLRVLLHQLRADRAMTSSKMTLMICVQLIDETLGMLLQYSPELRGGRP